MSVYTSIIRPLLFSFDPERIHNFTINYLALLGKFPFARSIVRCAYPLPNCTPLQKEVFGIQFPHPVGLAAGLDKNARAYNMFGAMGFSFVEVGTVTPKAQPGNDLPRLFRLPNDKALINRMGFNNHGVAYMAKQLRKRNSKVIIGGNIGKNKITPNEDAVNDYVQCFNELFNHVDYFVVNVSSPNTPNLRALQDKEPLTHLLQTLMQENAKRPAQKPILLKIAPDLTHEQLDDIIEIVRTTAIAGVVATNTTITRNNLTYAPEYIENIGAGGLSGAPETAMSTEVIRYLHTKSNGSFPIIGVGGIMTPEDAVEKLEAGAALVQLYSGFIYEGPPLIAAICKRLLAKND
ncbi:MAG: quinone-dependent dihydroorotate dehydrogenase [Bacteroidales bacterium]|jgi:dihydroorotate dehydrogenase|nr:quinone-dependent dihydroorotate dehydrogenase [Bacteroidales bacterium]